MSNKYQPYASIAPSQNDNAYIFALVPAFGNGLAAITSTSELLVIDRQNLLSASTVYLQHAPTGANCLIQGDAQGQSLICSGTDGTVATFDLRSRTRTYAFNLDRAVTSIACNGLNIAVGTECDSKFQQAIVSLWDTRQQRQVWQNAENNDEITVTSFHPTKPNIVLAGGDDGLISLFDTNIAEEQDSLLQAINHGPIHKAGFLGDSRIFALSSDQNFAVHPVSTPGDEEDPSPTLIGDLRPIIPCQYVIDILRSGEDYIVAAGMNIEKSCIDLVKLEDATNLGTSPVLNSASKYTIEPAHGEEVVRALVIDDEAGVIFTAGEDGFIRASRPPQSSDLTSKISKAETKHKRSSSSRYKPY